MKSSQGIVYKRREKILQLLKEHKKVLVQDLSQLLSVSEITIRRDLQKFDEEGIVERFYGGAELKEGSLLIEEVANQVPNEIKTEQTGKDVKELIALYASKMVKEGDTIFINSGSTAFQLLTLLSNKKVTIITNNGKAINEPKAMMADVVLSGGEIYEQKQSLVGDFAIHTFSKVVANICFLSVGGININGITTFALSETAVNRTILERTNGPRIVLADGKKVGKENNFITSDIALVTHLITDSSANMEEVNKLKNRGVEVIFVDQ